MKNINKKLLIKLSPYIIGFILGIFVLKSITWFNDRYKLYCPIVISRSTVCLTPHQIIQEASGSARLTPTTSQINYEEIFDKIWQKETSRGKAVVGWHLQCREIGKWNEIGWNPWKTCFNSKAEGKTTFIAYAKKKIESGYSLEEFLCFYNTGIRQTGCRYYKDYLKI